MIRAFVIVADVKIGVAIAIGIPPSRREPDVIADNSRLDTYILKLSGAIKDPTIAASR